MDPTTSNQPITTPEPINTDPNPVVPPVSPPANPDPVTSVPAPVSTPISQSTNQASNSHTPLIIGGLVLAIIVMGTTGAVLYMANQPASQATNKPATAQQPTNIPSTSDTSTNASPTPTLPVDEQGIMKLDLGETSTATDEQTVQTDLNGL